MELRDYIRLVEDLAAGRKIEVPMYSLGCPEEHVVGGLVGSVLANTGQNHIENAVLFVLKELLQNAENAVFVGAYLQKSGRARLDPATAQNLRGLRGNPKEQKRMRRELPQKGPAPIVVRAEQGGDALTISIANRGALSEEDRARIDERIALGAKHKNIEGLGEQQLATDTGRGYGLILALLSMRSAGISRHLLWYDHDEKRTEFTFEVPLKLPPQEKLKEIEQGIIAEVTNLPTLPDHLVKIRELCESPDSSIKQIAGEISQDQAMAGQMIRLANSGGFAGGRIVDLGEAVKVVGLKHVSQFLLQIGSFEILLNRYGDSDELTQHPIRVGYFSRALARKSERAKLADYAYVAGLLHDIGKVVLLSAMELREDLDHLSKDRDLRGRIRLEELACGAGHALIGALLAHKWKFPEILRHPIEHHHSPLRSPDEHRDLVMIVYLANAMAGYLDGRLSFFSIAPAALEFFNLTTEDAFKMTAGTFEAEFREIQER